MSHDLHDIAERYWALICREDPIAAITAGYDTQDDALLRAAPEDHDRRAGAAAVLLEELDGVDLAALDRADRASAQLLRRELVRACRLHATQAHLRPSLYPLGPEFTLSYFAGQVSVSTVSEAARYLARLRSIPAGFRGLRQALTLGREKGLRYPRLALQRAIDNVRGQIAAPVEQSSFYGPLAKVAGRSDGFAEAAREGLGVVTDVIYPAFAAYADFLETELLPVARESLACTDDPDGDAFYRAQIESNVTLDADPDELHAIGLAEVARLEAAMIDVARSVGFGDDLVGFRTRLRGDNQMVAPSGEALREEIEILSKRIDARLPEFFGRLPRMSYGVRSIPEAIAEKMPPAYAQPNPADGTAAGIHWITSVPEKCPRYMHIPLAMHEAWPGHLMHLALMQEMTDLPAFRRHGAMGYSACLEGWALYCESLGEDLGLYDTPEKRYGRLEMEMWRAVRLVVDTGVHAKGWSREQSIAYFADQVALPATTIEAEVDRYISLPAQALGYQIGNIRFREMRRRAEDRLGADFSLRDFHDALMAAGPATLEVLDRIIDDWIDERVRIAA